MKEYIFLGALILGAGIIGWFGNDIYRDKTNYRDYDGLWMPTNYNKVQALETAYNYDSVGNWICVNIKGMELKDMEETVMHEIGHEAFARYCSKNVTKCLEVVENGNS